MSSVFICQARSLFIEFCCFGGKKKLTDLTYLRFLCKKIALHVAFLSILSLPDLL